MNPPKMAILNYNFTNVYSGRPKKTLSTFSVFTINWYIFKM
jgi:hypothetical protein